MASVSNTDLIPMWQTLRLQTALLTCCSDPLFAVRRKLAANKKEKFLNYESCKVAFKGSKNTSMELEMSRTRHFKDTKPVFTSKIQTHYSFYLFFVEMKQEKKHLEYFGLPLIYPSAFHGIASQLVLAIRLLIRARGHLTYF